MARKVFKAGGKWYHNAIAGGQHSGPYPYILGYYDAADSLVQIAMQERAKLDTLFFPICFNYRHFIELSLKHLIILVQRYQQFLETLESRKTPYEDVSQQLEQEHSLEKLLNWLVERFNCLGDEKFDGEIHQIIIEFHNLDPKGQTFRYPFQKGGRLSLPKQESYDIANITAQMEKVRVYLDGMDAWLDENSHLAAEMFYEFQQDNYNDWPYA